MYLYGSESWTLDSRDKRRIQAAEMKSPRRPIGKTKTEKYDIQWTPLVGMSLGGQKLDVVSSVQQFEFY